MDSTCQHTEQAVTGSQQEVVIQLGSLVVRLTFPHFKNQLFEPCYTTPQTWMGYLECPK
jgi:hypothetical protein